MRAVAIPALLLLALAGLAVVPTASAAPPDPCNGTIGGGPTVGPVAVFVSPPCLDVYVDAMSCPLGNGEWTDHKVGNVGVHVYTCSEDPATTSAAAPPCTCPPPPMCHQVTTVGPLAELVSVTVTSDCRVIVAVLPSLIACSDPLDGAKAVTVGRVTVWLPCGEVGPCEPPVECYPASAPQAFDLCDSPGLCNDAGCPYPMGAERGTDLQVGPLRITHACGPQDLCSGPLRCTSPFQTAYLPVCIEREVSAGVAKAGFDQCRQSHEDTACSNGSPQRIHHYEQVGPAYAQIHFCFPHTPPPSLASTSAVLIPPVCIRKQAEVGPVAADVGQCEAQQVTIDLCSGTGPGIDHTVDQKPVLVGFAFCFPHMAPPQLSVAASDPGPCGAANPMQRCPAPVPLCSGVSDDLAAVGPSGPVGADVAVASNCHVDVYVKADVMDCLWGEGYNQGPSAGPVTVWTWGCSEPTWDATAAQAPPCTCPPPQPLCRPVTTAVSDSPYFGVSDTCDVTVNVEAYCGLQGTEQHQQRVGKVTVNYQTCQQPPQGLQSAAMADPFPTCVTEPCGPSLPDVGCALRDATPAPLRNALWGYSGCTLYAHTACVGGASSSTDLRVAFLDVSIAHCSGPAWS